MDCLLDYIGIRDGNEGPYEDQPESGLYINTLPGIIIESIHRTATPDQVTLKRVWEDIQTEAAVRFLIDFINEVSKCHSLSKDCDYEEMLCENKFILVNAWRYLLGNQTMIFRIYSTRLNRWTTIDKKEAEKLKDYYQVEYEAALKQAALLIDVSSCELCCGGNPQVVTFLP